MLEVPGRGYVVRLRVGGLDPVDTESGLTARLRHLGFLGLTSSGEASRVAAILKFQRAAGLKETGDADGPTRDALQSRYGC
jgi:hypothetical protein